MSKLFFSNYFKNLQSNLNDIDLLKLEKLASQIKKCKKKKGKLVILGNGGSSSTSNHLAIDFTKNAKIKAISFSDSSLITCLCNDYGHENWMSKALELYANKDDIVIFISCSGNSKNIVNAAKYCINKKIKIATFTGMSKKNKLKLLNKDIFNFWINSKAYNFIELLHLAMLLSVVDFIIGKTIYKAS